MREIKRVAVLGSGVMGAAIAAHLANCGIPSVMLDIVPPNLPPEQKGNKAARNAFAEKAKAALFKAKPSPLYKQSSADLIAIGNFDDDMHALHDCDWIIEVVKEDLQVKRVLLERIIEHRREGTILSSNTSGISIKAMAEILPEEVRQRFLGTHFFNPPRYLHLLELIPHEETLPEVLEMMATFGENVLGKGIVYAKDTPNFIANRVLTFAMQWTLHNMVDAGLSVEEVDALTGPMIGHASSATFRTADLVGLDTFQHVVGNVYNGCPNDERRDLMKGPDWVDQMVAKGWYGDKTGSGFFKATNERDEKGKRVILGIDPATVEYRAPVKPRFECTGKARGLETLEEKLKVMHFSEDDGSKFLFRLFANLAQYAGNRIPEIADDIVNIDNACKWGFNWEIGIFETWDVLGFHKVCERMAEEGIALPPIAKMMKEAGADSFYKYDIHGYRQYFDLRSKSYKLEPTNPKSLSLAQRRRGNKVVRRNEGCDLIDLGDGILCAAFHSKMNAIDADIMHMLQEGVNLCNDDKFEGLVIANQEEHFCVGANLMMVLMEINQQNWSGVETAVRSFQEVNMHLKYCRKPVVAAPHHYTFGGGVEICQHAAKVVVAGETYAGLVEVGVGLIPAGGGTKEMVVRAFEYIPESLRDSIDAFPYIRRAFENIATAKVGTSGAEVIEYGYFRTSDVLLPNFHHQVQKAKDVCLGLAQAGYTPPPPPRLSALGEPARAAFRTAVWGMNQAGFASEHDMLIAEKVAHILTGGDRRPGSPVTEQQLLELEREAFCSLCGMEKTQARIQHMLMTNKPLRN